MPKANLKNLSKLLNAFRKDGKIQVVRKDGIATIITVSDDYAALFKCAIHEGSEDSEQTLQNVELRPHGAIVGDVVSEPVHIPRLQMPKTPIINCKIDAGLFAEAIKIHASIKTAYDRRTGKDVSTVRMDFKSTANDLDTRLFLSTHKKDVGIKQSIVSTHAISPTNRLLNQLYDAKILCERIFKYVTPDNEIEIEIAGDAYPLELFFRVDGIQCHYTQACRLNIN